MEDYEGIARGLSVLARSHQSYMAGRLADAGIGFGQHILILAVTHDPGVGQDPLARRLILNKSTVARAVAQLEENGYIRREENPDDGRAWKLYPTDKARDVFPLIAQCTKESVARITEGMAEEDAATLSRLLRVALDNLVQRQKRCEDKAAAE